MSPPTLSRRAFLASCFAAVATGSSEMQDARGPRRPSRVEEPDRAARLARIGSALRQRYADLPSHFIFEYYPWYATDPWRHWNGSGRTPPAEIAAATLPLLGPYDSRSARVLEQHARWIAEAGVGAVNLSWWGRGSYEDNSVNLVMDVMHDHGLAVTFHLEPYSPERGARFVDDVLYLIREYGERRRWDAFLLLDHADGTRGPLLKTFATLLSPTRTDCRGVRTPAPDYVPDWLWRQQTTRVRRELASDFDRITLLGDSLDVFRVQTAAFDGATSGDPYLHPDQWPMVTSWFDAENLLLAFAVNPGFEGIEPKPVPDDPCYAPPRFDPPADVDWATDQGRERAHAISAERIASSFEQTLALQTSPRSANWRQGFFVAYVNSFNEWHEGTPFEPMRSFRELSGAERAIYHNPLSGSYRLEILRDLVSLVT